jgi:hypothetical protein
LQGYSLVGIYKGTYTATVTLQQPVPANGQVFCDVGYAIFSAWY